MGLFSGGKDDRTKEEREVARLQHKAYKKALDEHYEWCKKHPSQLEETPTYNQLNSAVIDAEKDVPWWRR